MTHPRLRRAGPAAAALLLGLAGAVAADDDFAREGDRTDKDPLEGRPPPELRATGWLNVEVPEAGLELADLRGKVVVIDFWGTW